MTLDPVTQDDKDNPLCRVRPDQGLDAISELAPGIVTGPLTVVWKRLVDEALDMGYEPDKNLIVVPYDFRLAPSLLEERDQYFSKLKNSIETAVAYDESVFRRRHPAMGQHVRGAEGATIVAHSMGNNVFLYFAEWLRLHLGDTASDRWLDHNVHTYMAVGAPLLGSPETIQAAVSGHTVGLPITEHEAREMGASFSSTGLLFPLSPTEGEGCESALPLAPVSVTFQNGTKKEYPCNLLDAMVNDLAPIDKHISHLQTQVKNFYRNDPVFNGYPKPWKRPKVRNVICIYGTNIKTITGFHFTQGSQPNTWSLWDTIFEDDSVLFDSERKFETGMKSGDGSVPYYSLSWCHRWLGPSVNITRVPQEEGYAEEDVEREENVNTAGGEYHMRRSTSKNQNTFYEETHMDHSGNQISTGVWEMDHMDHRYVLQSPLFLNEMRHHLETLQTRTDAMEDHLEATIKDIVHRLSVFASHDQVKIPTVDEDCAWDYAGMHCMWPSYCEYRYVFGDYHLSQSCRLKTTRTKSLQNAKETTTQVVPVERKCECVDDACYHGICLYLQNCEGAVRPFGESGGYWGKCPSEEPPSKPKQEL